MWLKNLLNRDAVLCEIVRREAAAAGFTKRDLRTARAILGVKTYHQIDGDVSNWFWYLPEGDANV